MGSADQLGFESEETYLNHPKLCNYSIVVQQIACGDAHTLILSRQGFVYSMGSNIEGVLGHSEISMKH
jgi:alpha-tubulin suppressor-like RCC1 family protein